ncbi:hypothetical protein HMPREF9413_4395 [Paenibacillus sp. HGF7]|nr:cyclic-phosphate processing receiver domain-containing protein [Paenibacillus sp. HGF7]EGL17807.1 hypothetical protein HMPREF9413_4395 [Paenibacillus sp. HGF7]
MKHIVEKGITIMINVYVDDLRDCPIGFVVARTFQEAIHLLETHEVDILSLDHDLGEDLQGNLLPTGKAHY